MECQSNSENLRINIEKLKANSAVAHQIINAIGLKDMSPDELIAKSKDQPEWSIVDAYPFVDNEKVIKHFEDGHHVEREQTATIWAKAPRYIYN